MICIFKNTLFRTCHYNGDKLFDSQLLSLIIPYCVQLNSSKDMFVKRKCVCMCLFSPFKYESYISPEGLRLNQNFKMKLVVNLLKKKTKTLKFRFLHV